MAECFYCHQPETADREMRPYGPSGSWVCFPCATSPGHEAATQAAFGALLEAAGAFGPAVISHERGGVRPATDAEVKALGKVDPRGE